MPTRLWITVIALMLLVAGGLGGALIWQNAGQANAGGKASIGGPFSLVDQTGGRVTEKDFEGRFMLAYFGYTFCPDFCPLGLSTITEAINLLDPEEAEKVAPVFFTVDPERDTVERLADYASHFHPRLSALTGTDEDVAAAAKAFRVYHAIPNKDGDDYAVDHSTFIYLMAPDGTYRTHFNHSATPEEVADRLRYELKNP